MAPTEAERIADARRRREALRERLVASGLDAAIATNQSNVTYLTAYTTPSSANRSRPIVLVLPSDGPPHAILSQAEVQRVAEWDPEIVVTGYSHPSASLSRPTGPDYVAATVDAIVECLDESSRLFAIESSGPSLPGLPPGAVDALAARTNAELVDLDELIWPLRLRKSAVEIECLRNAAGALELTFATFAKNARPGMSERELLGEFAAAAARSDADHLGYAVIVAGTDRSILGAPSDRPWQEGELLTVDAGVVSNGYWADYCRHYVAGKATVRQGRSYARIVEAVRTGRGSTTAGVTAGGPAKAMAGVLGEQPDAFGRLGHGIGLDLTEPPSLHPGMPRISRPG